MNLDGTKLATASDKGTLIRIFDTESGQLQQELRRGADRAEIYSVAFSPNSQFLACSSDKCTVHVFALSANGPVDTTTLIPDAAPAANEHLNRTVSTEEDDGTGNSKSSFSFMRGILPKYFSSEWSFAQFRVPETRTICAFGVEKNTIIGKLFILCIVLHYF